MSHPAPIRLRAPGEVDPFANPADSTPAVLTAIERNLHARRTVAPDQEGYLTEEEAEYLLDLVADEDDEDEDEEGDEEAEDDGTCPMCGQDIDEEDA